PGPGGGAGDRLRSGRTGGRLGPDLRTVPAARRPGQHHRRRPRAGALPRPGRGGGRHPRTRGHPGWRPDHGSFAAGNTGAGAGAAVSRVLVVEDDPQLLRAMRITLHARGHEVVTAATGRKALSEAAAARPDLVVLDLGLPDLDGVEVIEGLR